MPFLFCLLCLTWLFRITDPENLGEGQASREYPLLVTFCAQNGRMLLARGRAEDCPGKKGKGPHSELEFLSDFSAVVQSALRFTLYKVLEGHRAQLPVFFFFF